MFPSTNALFEISLVALLSQVHAIFQALDYPDASEAKKLKYKKAEAAASKKEKKKKKDDDDDDEAKIAALRHQLAAADQQQ
ncbi:hypothetical protein PG989_001845 [Apiospora arundinis]